jgi:hypothetical protein
MVSGASAGTPEATPGAAPACVACGGGAHLPASTQGTHGTALNPPPPHSRVSYVAPANKLSREVAGQVPSPRPQEQGWCSMRFAYAANHV